VNNDGEVYNEAGQGVGTEGPGKGRKKRDFSSQTPKPLIFIDIETFGKKIKKRVRTKVRELGL